MTEKEAERYGKLNRMEQDQVMHEHGEYVDEEQIYNPVKTINDYLLSRIGE